MKKFLELTESKKWKLWMAIGWTVLEICWGRELFELIVFVQNGVYPGGSHLMAQGLLVVAGLYVAVTQWRDWFLYDKKQNHLSDEEK